MKEEALEQIIDDYLQTLGLFHALSRARQW